MTVDLPPSFSHSQPKVNTQTHHDRFWRSIVDKMLSTVATRSPSSSPTPVPYAPLVPSPLNPNGFQTSPTTSPPGSPSPQMPPPKRPNLRRTASQTSPTQILLRQKAAAAFRSESLIKAYSNNSYISLGSSRRHASSRNPFLNMTQHKNLTTADTIDILYSLDIDDDDSDFAGDIGLISSSNSNKPLPPVPMPPPLFSSSSTARGEKEQQQQQQQQLEEKDDFDFANQIPYYEDYEYERDKEEINLESGSFERERTTLLSGSISSLVGPEGQGRRLQRRGGGHNRSGVTRLVIHVRRGLVILGIVIMFVLLHGLLRTFGGARRLPPDLGYAESDSKNWALNLGQEGQMTR